MRDKDYKKRERRKKERSQPENVNSSALILREIIIVTRMARGRFI